MDIVANFCYSVDNNYLLDDVFIEAYDKLTRKEQNEVLIEFGKWGLEHPWKEVKVQG